MSLKHESLLNWPILYEPKIKCISAKKKIQNQKNISKSNSNHTVIIYLHCLERQKILATSNISKATKKILDWYGRSLKG